MLRDPRTQMRGSAELAAMLVVRLGSEVMGVTLSFFTEVV